MPDLAALLVATPEALVAALQLPAGCHIDSVSAPHDRPGVLILRLRGAGWPTEIGERLREVVGTVTKHHGTDGRDVVIDWGLPCV